MRHTAAFVLTGLLVAALGCAKSPSNPQTENTELPSVSASDSDTVRIRVGQFVKVQPEGLIIAFKEVASDSRCPADVVCVWAGDAVVRLDLTFGRMAWTSFDVHTGLEPRSATFRGLTVELVDLKPVPLQNDRPEQREYVAGLVVKKAS